MIKTILAVLLALLYSIAYCVIGPMTKAQNFSFSTSQILPLLLCFVLCSIFNILMFSVIPKIHFDWKSERINGWLDKLGKFKFFLIVWAFIFVSWIPAYLILYPGVLAYDMPSQVRSALGTIDLNHHPVLHTWLIRVFLKIGNNLFSSYEFGIGLLSLLQMLLLSYALARLVSLLKKKNVPVWFVLGTTLVSALWFMNACLSVTMIKDTLHAAFLILFACHFTEIVLNPLEYSKQKRNLILLPIVSFFMCAFRNNGIHIYVFCFAVLTVLWIIKIKKVKAFIPLIIAILLPVFMFKIYSGPVFEALNIQQGEVREALSVPIQQLQRVAINKAGELTEDQAYLMNYYITDLAWREWDPGRKYDPFVADPAKSCFISVHYNEDPKFFWNFYLETGKQFSKEYVAAFLSNTVGFWYPGFYEQSYVVYEDYPSEEFDVPLERKSIVNAEGLKTFYESVCQSEFWRKTPVVRLFFVTGFAPWILCYALILSWKKKGFFTKVFPLFLPMIAQYGIMILSPIASFRYSWPYFLMLPLCFIAIWGRTEVSEHKASETTVEV